MAEERRCPTCGALVSEDAEWCGQCFTSLREPSAPPEPAVPEPPAFEPAVPAAATATAGEAQSTPRQAAFWPCSVCGAHNPIAFEVCETCGTPFAAVMRGVERQQVDPRVARTRSMIFPGAGHALLGYPIDGFARGAVFALSLGLAIFLAVSVPRSGPMLLAITLLVATAVGVYALSLTETRQLSERGGGLLIPSKYLLWGCVALMFIIVGTIALSIAGNARR
jgi:ribosomal protein L40E